MKNEKIIEEMVSLNKILTEKVGEVVQKALKKSVKVEKDYFERQITGLILIMQSNENSFMVSRKYVVDKLNMILNGGIGFHALIEEKLNVL